VVVGASVSPDADVFGDTPNIPARVADAAEPGTVAISDATHRLVSGLFVVEDLGAQALKGIERPLQLYRVIRPSGVRGRFEAAATAGGLTPFVGREDESRILMTRWERTLDGEGQVALMIGQAGIDKSRLVQRFHEQIASTPHTWVECATAPFYQNSPFYPVAAMLRELLAIRADQPNAEQFALLEPGLGFCDFNGTCVARLRLRGTRARKGAEKMNTYENRDREDHQFAGVRSDSVTPTVGLDRVAAQPREQEGLLGRQFISAGGYQIRPPIISGRGSSARCCPLRLCYTFVRWRR
jgi:hypothetical protein